MECLSRYFSNVQIDKLSSYKFLSRFSFFDVGHVEETVRFRITVYDSPWTGSSVMMTMILVRSPFALTIFFFPGIKSRSPFDFCARTTFVGERHHRIRYGSTICLPPPSARFWSSFSLIQSKLTLSRCCSFLSVVLLAK